VKAIFKFILILILLSAAMPANSYVVTYKEQFYRLFHLHYSQYPDDTIENIYWLEQAIKAPFANPLYAFTKIETELEWEKYRYLFNMHLHIKLIEQYLFLANKWNKREAYFYNAPWRDENLDSLEIAESCFRTALFYWDEAVSWAQKANERRFRWLHLPGVQFWADEAFRIEEGTLSYKRTIERELRMLQEVRDKFKEMETWYHLRNTAEPN